MPLSVANFNLYPFTVINHNHKYNSFAEFFESFYEIVEPETSKDIYSSID